MTAIATATMILICGLVWGGFLFLLVRAVGREGKKLAGGDQALTGDGDGGGGPTSGDGVRS